MLLEFVRGPALTAALLPVVLLFTGCALHTGGVEHYVGPVLFRYVEPSERAGGVSQVRRGGVLIDAGRQWGVAAGVTDRVAILPMLTAGTERAAKKPRWTTPWNPFGDPVPSRWNLSLFYLRVEDMWVPAFVRRQTYGLEMTAGEEARAASLGWTSRTLIAPPDDTLSLLRFDSRNPLDTVFMIWPAGVVPDPASLRSRKEPNP